jgi:hypothetical protein
MCPTIILGEGLALAESGHGFLRGIAPQPDLQGIVTPVPERRVRGGGSALVGLCQQSWQKVGSCQQLARLAAVSGVILLALSLKKLFVVMFLQWGLELSGTSESCRHA